MPDHTETLSAMVELLDRLLTRVEGGYTPGAHRLKRRIRPPQRKVPAEQQLENFEELPPKKRRRKAT